MKLNISYPANGTQKLVEIEDERKLRIFMDRRMGQEVPADSLGPEFAGYVFKITGGNDKQGFPMKQGIMHPTRVRLLLSEGHSCYRPRRTGERKRKSVRGCIVGMDLSVLALAIVKQGEGELPGLTDTEHAKRLGPKRATKIRRFFNLTKEDDVSANRLLVLTSFVSSYVLWKAQWENRAYWIYPRSAASLFAGRFSLRLRARNHTPRLLVSSVSSLLNVSSISVTIWLSSAVVRKLLRMLRYVMTFKTWLLDDMCTNIGTLLQNDYAAILAKRVNEEKAKKNELRSKYKTTSLPLEIHPCTMPTPPPLISRRLSKP